MAEFAPLAKNVNCHAWNADGTKVALCPNSQEIRIYKFTKPNKFALEHTLAEHDQLVSSIDWHADTNKIVSCSHDRNAYVWTFDAGSNTWLPSLCILQINRAATCVRWSPQGNKFAVGSGAKVISVCHFQQENNWWVPKQFPAHESTVLACAWHPNNMVLATCSSDRHCRLFSGYHREADDKAKQPKLGESLADFANSMGWVRDVAWSPSGAFVAWCGQDSTIYVADLAHPQADGPSVQHVRCPDLPFRSLLFLSETAIVAGGDSANPTLFTYEGGEWIRKVQLDRGDKKQSGPASKFGGANTSTFTRDAFTRFQNATAFGTADMGASGSSGSSSASPGVGGSPAAAASKAPTTIHQNPIVEIRAVGRHQGVVTSISTAGLDGRLVVWDLPTLGIEELMRALSV